MDKLYPSPLREKTKYTGELNDRRKHDKQPIPVSSGLLLSGLSSADYENAYTDWVDRQVKLDNLGFKHLAKHYGLDLDGPEFYMNVALHLARDHVPAFSMVSAAGATAKWTDLELKLLVLRVHIKMKEHNVSRAKAILLLSQSGAAYGYNGERAGLKNMVIKGEKLFDASKLDCLSLEELHEVERYQLGINSHAKKSLKDWKD